jgi:NAD(P)H-quinone oxidoreductase subunit 5
MHGWLIQVVEAPTPVSALLHGGIINLGGYLLILFGPLLMLATAAQWLVLVVAGLTAVLAALVMATRISIKVKLAWSTAAQMGLMLVECALGLFHLALLHLVAHACYKAYCFLDAGSAVEKDLARRLAPARMPTAAGWLGAAVVTLPVAVGVPVAMGWATPLAPWLLLGLALTVVVAERSSVSHRGALLVAAGAAALVAGVYAAQKWLVHWVTPALPASAGTAADLWVCALIVGLACAYAILRYRPEASLSGRLAVWLYAGFYLDEWATRTTLRLWPVRLPVRANPKRLPILTEEVS